MPVVFIIAATFGLICAGFVPNWTADLSLLNYYASLWHGLFVKDILVAILKASFFGGTIALISCSCGYNTVGGAKEVGLATTKAVVWSFLAIAVWDFIFASVFYLQEKIMSLEVKNLVKKFDDKYVLNNISF